jgi:hypothetical protein
VVTILNVTPSSESYGEGAGVAIDASLTWIGGGAAPTAANSQWLTFSSTAAGIFGAVTCSGAKSIQCGVEFMPASANGDVLTCKVNYQPSRKLSVGTYQNYLTATMGASGDYKTASGHANLVVQTK